MTKFSDELTRLNSDLLGVVADILQMISDIYYPSPKQDPIPTPPAPHADPKPRPQPVPDAPGPPPVPKTPTGTGKAKGKKVSARGIDAIKRFEGFRAEPYRDSVGVLTVGYGTTTNVQGRVSLSQAHDMMMGDINKIEDAISTHVSKPLLQHELDAMASLAYNIGTGALARSSLVAKFNAGDKYGAADEFLRWKFASGKPLEGLEKRRRAERRIFLSSNYGEV